MTYFDSHAHLTHPKIFDDVVEVIERAKANCVSNILCVGYDADSSFKSVNLAQKNEGVWAAVGISPHDVATATDKDWSTLRTLVEHPKVVACGETGLDYHYMRSPRQLQMDALRKHLRLAKEFGKPVILHLRGAEGDLFQVLDEEGVPERGGVLHCFTGDAPTAQRAVERGLMISFSGILTFPKADSLSLIPPLIPPERLLVETDCPYLAPVPHRGKTCEPFMLARTVERLSTLLDRSQEVLSSWTERNAKQLLLSAHGSARLHDNRD